MTAATVNAADPARWPEAKVWMQAARALTVERHPYLDTALTTMLLVERPGLRTVAVDARWRIYYDPQRTLELVAEYGIDALTADWVHEVMHLLRHHHARWESLHDAPQFMAQFNIAADALVNADVTDLGMAVLPDWVTFDRLPPEAGCTRTMTTEEIYARLRMVKRTTPVGDPDCGSGAGGNRRPWEDFISDDAQDRHDDGSADDERAVMVREDTARNVLRHIAAGRHSNGLRQWAESVLNPTVNWRHELRSITSKRLGTAAGRRDYSYRVHARRHVPGFVLPGMVTSAPATVAVVVDTSGSMRPSDLNTCLGELLGLARATGGDGAALTVITCDAAVTGMHKVRTLSSIRQLELMGGGGTDMVAGITACAALRPAPEVVVVMTDGDTLWPATPGIALRNTRVIALLTRGGRRWRSVPDWITTIIADPDQRMNTGEERCT